MQFLSKQKMLFPEIIIVNYFHLCYDNTYKDVLFDKIFSDKKAILELYNAIAQTDYTDKSAVAAKRAVEECIKHGILKDILPKEKGVIEDMITVCYDEEIHKMREAEYNQELGEERGKEIGKLLQPETI